MSLSPSNRETFINIEQAAFVLCLDDSTPRTARERVNEMFWNHSLNRWNDKPCQFIISGNGVSASLFEHSMLDGPSVKQLLDRISDAIRDHEPVSPDLQDHQENIILEECVISTNTEVRSEIARAQREFEKNVAPWEYSGHTFQKFGTDYFRAIKIPPKSAWQIIIQLASRMYFGYQPASWETVMINQFHKGRVDTFQSVTPPTMAFLDAISESNGTVKENILDARPKFLEAAASHAAGVTKTMRGKGF